MFDKPFSYYFSSMENIFEIYFCGKGKYGLADDVEFYVIKVP